MHCIGGSASSISVLKLKTHSKLAFKRRELVRGTECVCVCVVTFCRMEQAVNQVMRDRQTARARSQGPEQHSQVASGGLPVGAAGKGTGGQGDEVEAEEGEQAALGGLRGVGRLCYDCGWGRSWK
jgi:hypothetical protein